MSEYQYYEFLALDRPLTSAEKTYVQSLSSRVQLTSTQAVFVYNYGDFRGDPKQVLEKCFDVMLYMANWGSRQLMFRLPKSLVDPAVFAPYCQLDAISISTTRDFIILDIDINDEEMGEWSEGEGWLSSLVSLRDDLLRGDLRSLYLAWLKAAPMEYSEADLLEPPIPANLQTLSSTLQAFVEFFGIDQDLITAAATASIAQAQDEQQLEDLIPLLSEQECHDFLVRVARGEPQVRIQLKHRLRELSHKPKNHVSNDTSRRTLSELLELAEQESDRREKEQHKEAYRIKVQTWEALAKKEASVWTEVFQLIALKQAKPYDQAVAYLRELRDLAKYKGRLADFQSRIRQIQQDYSNRPGLISRLHQAKLL
ncbi:hypothetical protein [Nostoc sp. TCL26-01]|uniref:hypothetical protein n=1 Tax=Nostoc sp. TCL26-01 TaxID=2576904 RepID=UPI0015B86C2E|nr:hypothetical protein [Nostoc sp. TCL26-01]QLE54206.1 hypothetical protein FD725_00880 [Nostoc sp. TCL26-01]